MNYLIQCMVDGKLFTTPQQAYDHKCPVKQQSGNGGLVGMVTGSNQQSGPRRFMIVTQD